MDGPLFQLPAGALVDIRKDDQGQQALTRMDWAGFFRGVSQTLYAQTRSGTTAERPTSTMPYRFTGMQYFDTTLGLPIWLKTASSNAWVKADGTPA